MLSARKSFAVFVAAVVCLFALPGWVGQGQIPDQVTTGAGLVLSSNGTSLVWSQRQISVKDYGAKGDGSTDDSTAISSALSALSTAGGGTLYVPLGTFIVNPTSTNQILFTVPSNVAIQGASTGGSIIRLKSTVSVDYHAIFGNAGSVSRVSFSDLTIDQNPNASNHIPSGSQYPIYFAPVTGLTVQRMNFLYSGSNAVNTTLASSLVKITDNDFTFEPIGSTSYDNSGVYTHAAYQTIVGNHFQGASTIPASTLTPTGEGGIEVHLGPGTVTGNVVENYVHGMNVVGADGTDAAGAQGGFFTISGNNLRGCDIGILLWTVFQSSNPYGFQDTTIADNTIGLAQNEWNFAATAASQGNTSQGIATLQSPNSATIFETLKIVGNHVIYEPYLNYALTSTTGIGVNPIVVTTSTANTFTTGMRLTLSGITGNTNANGTNIVTVLSSTTFSLPGSVVANGTGSGGTATNFQATAGGAVSQVAGVYLDSAAALNHLDVVGNTILHSPGRGVNIDDQFGTTTWNSVRVSQNSIVNSGQDSTAASGIYRSALYLGRTLSNAYIGDNWIAYDTVYPTAAQVPYALYINPSAATNVVLQSNNVASSAPSGAATPGYFVATVSGLTDSLSSGVGTPGSVGILAMGSTFTLGQHVGGGSQVDLLNTLGGTTINQYVAKKHLFAPSNGGTAELTIGPNGLVYGAIGIPCSAGGVIAAAAYPYVKLVPTGSLPSGTTTIQVTVDGSGDQPFLLDTYNLTFGSGVLKLQVGTTGNLWGPTAGGSGVTTHGVWQLDYNVSANTFLGSQLQ